MHWMIENMASRTKINGHKSTTLSFKVYRIHYLHAVTGLHLKSLCPIFILDSFFAHLSQNLSVVHCCHVIVFHVVVNFSHFHLLLQNHWANFNQTWHKVSLGKGDSSMFKWRTPPFSKGRSLQNCRNTLTN